MPLPDSILENFFTPALLARARRALSLHRVARVPSRDVDRFPFSMLDDPARAVLNHPATGDLLEWTCSCPDFQREHSCLHCCAALLRAEHEGIIPSLHYPPENLTARPVESPHHFSPSAHAWRKAIHHLYQAPGLAVWNAGEPATPVPGVIWSYLWTPDRGYGVVGGQIAIQTQRPKKSGRGHLKGTPLRDHPGLLATAPTGEDREILMALRDCPRGRWTQHHEHLVFETAAPFNAALLGRIAATGRLYLSATEAYNRWPDGPVSWREDEPLRVVFALLRAEADWLTVHFQLLDRNGRDAVAAGVEALPPFGAVDRKNLRLHPLLDPPDPAWLSQWKGLAPLRIHESQALDFIAAWNATPGCPPLALPEALRDQVVSVAPVPRLRIKSDEAGPFNLPSASVEFAYAGTWVEPFNSDATPARDAAGRTVLRQPGAEAALIRRLQSAGFVPLSPRPRIGSPFTFVAPGKDLAETLAALVHEGWVVESGQLRHRAASDFSLSVSSGVDWFELSGAVKFDGEEVPLPRLLTALRANASYVTLADGSRGILPRDWLAKLGRIAQLGTQEKDGPLRFKTSQALLLDALLATQPAVNVDTAFATARDRLRSFAAITPADPAPGFQGVLREYQREGLAWLRFLADFRLGGCLADDMGLGKTVQMLARLEERAALRRDPATPDAERPGPSLVIAPRSLMFNWMAEARRFCPSLRVLDWSGSDRRRGKKAFDDTDLVLTTYGVLRTEAAFLSGIEFDYAILDESQAIKNDKTASSKAARLLCSRHRIAMSGTPIENHLGELWSLFDFLNPGLLGASSRFERLRDAGPGDDGVRGLLAHALRPYILRRTKEQVAPELPPRTESTLYCELQGPQRREYDALRDFYRAQLLGRAADHDPASTMHVLEALLRLRQAACHTGLLDKAHPAAACAKFELLLPRLAELIEEGHKALVFSQFTSLLELLKPVLDKAGIAYEYLDGQTTDRQQRVERFQSGGSAPVFLISLKAGGVGLNLTAADYVFLLDPWWNPAAEAQAIDRAHRIGQERHVLAYRLIARDTIEERVLELQNSKRALADAILGPDNSLIRNLTRDDLDLLLR